MTAENLKLIKDALYFVAKEENEAIERAIANSPKPPESLYQRCDEKAREIIEERKAFPFKKAIAILIAAALLLTSCAIVYRDEIRGFIEEVTEHFTKLSHSDEATGGGAIEEIYEFTYVPEGYVLEESNANPLLIQSIFCNSDNKLFLEQRVLDSTLFFVDTEDYETILVVKTYDVYYKTFDGRHYYLWNDGKYAIKITSDSVLPDEELISIINGVKAK